LNFFRKSESTFISIPSSQILSSKIAIEGASALVKNNTLFVSLLATTAHR